jgi:hypothetical protein
MTDPRRRRLARNEALFREVNERVEAIATAHGDPHVVEFLCECVQVECVERIELALDAYEQIRADPALFVLRPGHERRDVEDVVEEKPGYVVVRKHEDTRPLTEDLDPRTD